MASSQSSSAQADTFVGRILQRIVDIRAGEARALFWSWLYVFAFFLAYGSTVKGAKFYRYRSVSQRRSAWELGLCRLGRVWLAPDWSCHRSNASFTRLVSIRSWLERRQPGCDENTFLGNVPKDSTILLRIQGTEHDHCWNHAYICRPPFIASPREQPDSEKPRRSISAQVARILCSASIAFCH